MSKGKQKQPCSWRSREDEPCRRPLGHKGKHKPPARYERPYSQAVAAEMRRQERELR